jgi:hypothetical protein
MTGDLKNMHYILFNNEILFSNGQVIKKIIKGPGLIENLDTIEKTRLCYVDVDVMIASAPQDYLDKKDSILVQKFQDFYSNEYITLNEKIDNNIFQVFGIKAEKVKEVYSLIPSSKVDAFVPYAIAIRSLLVNKQTAMSKLIVFVDDLENEKLITVFDGLKFSRTRNIYSCNSQDILPDIKRSSIDFSKKLGEFASNKVTGDFTIITNNKQMAEELKHLEPGLAVNFIDCRYPALEGLKFIDSQSNFRIHEEIILDRKKKERHSRLMHVIISIGICLAGAFYFGINQLNYSFSSRDFAEVKLKNSQLKDALNTLDQHIYQDSLKRTKNLNYSGVFFAVTGLLPSTYEISTFKLTGNEGHWIFDTYLFAQDDQFYDEIRKIKILKNAVIKDFFIKDRPGKYLRVAL